MIFRYSMIQDFLQCPKHFYDRHILGKIETEESSALHFGTALHLGVKTVLEQDDGVGAFKMYWQSIKSRPMRYYDQSWASLEELGEHFITNFKSRHAKKFTDFEQEVQMEMPFLDIYGIPVDEVIGNQHLVKYTIQGTADYIGKYEGKLTIADWKTSSKPYPKNKIELNPQMYIYAKLYEHKTGVLPEQILYKVFNKKEGSINTHLKPLTKVYCDSIFNSIENVARVMLDCVESKRLYHGADCRCERF